MQATILPNFARTLARSLALAGAAAALSLGSCQDVSTFVTGENYPRAPKNSPRVELEVVVQIGDQFYDSLGKEDMLDDGISERVLSESDMGMRFYPVAGSDYEDDVQRPTYVLTVQLRSMDVKVDTKEIEKKDEPTRTEHSVGSVDCVAAATLRKRREGRPALLVGESTGKGHVFVRSQSTSEDEAVIYPVNSQSKNQLYVTESDLLDAVDEAVVDALRGLIKSVDRELSLEV